MRTRWSEDEQGMQALYDYRDALPPGARLRVEHEHRRRSVVWFLYALGFLLVLIGTVVANGLGWADTIRYSTWWMDLMLIAMGAGGAYMLFDTRRAVRLGPLGALVVSMGLWAGLVVVVLLF